MIAVVNMGIGNIGSVEQILRKAGATNVVVTDDSEKIRKAEKICLPGVGKFDFAVNRLKELGLDTPIISAAQKGTPLLGICLGAQLMTEESEEGKLSGLGLIRGRTIGFKRELFKSQVKIPHMGWSQVDLQKESSLFAGMSPPIRFYHVHSFHFELDNADDIVGTTTHGYEFPVAFEHGNLLGVQFHPEKSHRFGLQLVRNFINLY